jgi:hypothetical protein
MLKKILVFALFSIALAAFNDTSATASSPACVKAITKASEDITLAVLAISKATSDCAIGYTDACVADINSSIDLLTDATAQLTDAAFYCSGSLSQPLALMI